MSTRNPIPTSFTVAFVTFMTILQAGAAARALLALGWALHPSALPAACFRLHVGTMQPVRSQRTSPHKRFLG